MTAHLKFAGKALGHDFHGIIGMSFIHKYIWDLDFDHKTIRVLSPDFAITPENYDTSIKIYPTPKGVPVLRIELMKNSIPFIIDTGETGSGRLTKEVIDFMIEKKYVNEVALDTTVSVSGIYSTRRVKVNHFKIGALEYSNLLMGESQQNAIGLRLLKRHRSILDFPSKWLYLRRGLNSFMFDREDKSGLKIIKDGANIVIEIVDKRGPAMSADLKKGDVIVSINRMPVNGDDLLRVRDILKGENDKEILIKIKRG
jgi:hypothetical protein